MCRADAWAGAADSVLVSFSEFIREVYWFEDVEKKSGAVGGRWNRESVGSGGCTNACLHWHERAVERASLQDCVCLTGDTGPEDLDALGGGLDAEEFENGIGIIGIQAGDELLYQGHAFVGRI